MHPRMIDESWERIFDALRIYEHDFDKEPFHITADQIKEACRGFTRTGNREVRILCKRDRREDRPRVFIDRELFLLPVKNGEYVIIKGEGYIDIPDVGDVETVYPSKLDFKLDTSLVGNSEMQHLDFAYASSLIRAFMGDTTLVLTIRGRKYTPTFDFRFCQHRLTVEGVQTEVDAGYEGRDQVVLVEAKGSRAHNLIIRQMYYPFRQWQIKTQKSVKTLLFQEFRDTYSIWEFRFSDPEDYASIQLVRAGKYRIQGPD